ncbi:MAG: ATP-binding cassette domain-containing protein, partial [bacterium]
MIVFRSVEKSFGDLAVLRGVNLEIEAGHTTAIIGGSGSGKSVLLKHIIGLLKPDRGQVLVDGLDIARLPYRD